MARKSPPPPGGLDLESPFTIGQQVRMYDSLPPGEKFQTGTVVDNYPTSGSSRIKLSKGEYIASWKRLAPLGPEGL